MGFLKIIGIATVALWLLLAIGIGMHTESFCLKHGYMGYMMDVAFNKYCYKRVDQTDVVIPVKDIK